MQVLEVLGKKTAELLAQGSKYLTTLNQRILPPKILATQNRAHIVETQKIIISEDPTLTDCGSSVLRNSKTDDLVEIYYADRYSNKEILCIDNFDDAKAIEDTIIKLNYKRNQDFMSIMLYGKKGKEPSSSTNAANLNGGVLNYKDTQEVAGEIKTLTDLKSFIEDAIVKIKTLIPFMDSYDFTFTDKDGNFKEKRFVLIAPETAGLDNAEVQVGTAVFMLKDYLYMKYKIDLVNVPQWIMQDKKFVLYPYHEMLGYFHIGTFSKVKMVSILGTQDVYEFVYESAGVIFSTGKLLIAKKAGSDKLEGGVDWSEKPNTTYVKEMPDLTIKKIEDTVNAKVVAEAPLKNSKNA